MGEGRSWLSRAYPAERGGHRTCHCSSLSFVAEEIAEASVCVTPEPRGLSFSSSALTTSPTKLRERLPMPRMRASATRANIASVKFRHSQGCGDSRNNNCCESRVDLFGVRIFGEPVRHV